MTRKLFLVAVLFFSLVALGAAPGSLDGTLIPRLDLEAPTNRVSVDDALMFRFTLSNSSSQTMQVLRWQTPMAGIEHDIFEITRNGKPVLYTGMLAKRAAPEPSDYLEIQAGESLTVTVDPSASYDMTEEGEYSIRYRTSFMTLIAGGKRASKSNTVIFDLENLGQSYPGEATKGVNCTAKPCHPKCPPNPELCGGGGGSDPTVEFVSCTSQQQGKALTAVTNATSISAASAADLADGSSSLYSTWFGAYKSNRYNTVDNHFQSISSAFETQTITINCSDSSRNVYAYVYPGNPYEIYVCRYFFSAPANGRDSASGTLVHEMSHFNVVAGTSDYVYGEAGALQLAQQSPRLAIKNADNHEYFAEDH